MSRVRAFGLFWWDFVVGDDPAIAICVVAMLGVCAVLTRAGVPAWWVPPVTVATVLAVSVSRARRRH